MIRAANATCARCLTAQQLRARCAVVCARIIRCCAARSSAARYLSFTFLEKVNVAPLLVADDVGLEIKLEDVVTHPLHFAVAARADVSRMQVELPRGLAGARVLDPLQRLLASRTLGISLFTAAVSSRGLQPPTAHRADQLLEIYLSLIFLQKVNIAPLLVADDVGRGGLEIKLKDVVAHPLHFAVAAHADCSRRAAST